MVDIDKIKREIVESLKSVGDIDKIILFGSYAYGEPNIDSDLDICIIKKNLKSKRNEKRKIRELLKSIRVPKDILVVDESYYLSHSDEKWINTALYDIREEGEVLYEAK